MFEGMNPGDAIFIGAVIGLISTMAFIATVTVAVRWIVKSVRYRGIARKMDSENASRVKVGLPPIYPTPEGWAIKSARVVDRKLEDKVTKEVIAAGLGVSEDCPGGDECVDCGACEHNRDMPKEEEDDIGEVLEATQEQKDFCDAVDNLGETTYIVPPRKAPPICVYCEHFNECNRKATSNGCTSMIKYPTTPVAGPWICSREERPKNEWRDSPFGKRLVIGEVKPGDMVLVCADDGGPIVHKPITFLDPDTVYMSVLNHIMTKEGTLCLNLYVVNRGDARPVAF